MLSREKILNNFSRSAFSYDQASDVQSQAAVELTKFFQKKRGRLISGDCLEIGCGTGLLTQQMLKLLPERQWRITDISDGMLDQCRLNLQSLGLLRESTAFMSLNGEFLPDASKYALIASNMVVQWFLDIETSLKRMQDHIDSGGVLLFSFPEASSFIEWKSMCNEAGVSYTGHPLPRLDLVKKCFCPLSWDLHIVQNKIATTHPRAINFFKQLKLIGAHASTRPQLKSFELKRLLEFWDARCPHGVSSTYTIVYIMAKRICKD